MRYPYPRPHRNSDRRTARRSGRRVRVRPRQRGHDRRGRDRQRRRRGRHDGREGPRRAAQRAAGPAQPPGGRPIRGQEVQAHAAAGLDRRRHRGLRAPRGRRLPRGQHVHPRLARGPRRGARPAPGRQDHLVAPGRAQARPPRAEGPGPPGRRREAGPRERQRRPRRPSKDGLEVRAARLQRDLERELLDSGASRRVKVRTETVKPDVSTEQLAEKYPAVLVVNRSAFQLTLYKNLKLAKTYGVAIGQVGLETPAGLYHIQNKAVNPAWTMPNSDWVAPADRGKVVPGGTAENPLKARWLGIFAGAGIHGTDAESSIGTAASHGCVRMRIPDVIELYDQVPVGAPIFIA